MTLQPYFERVPSILFKPDGSVLFECLCNGNPEPEVKWFFKDKECVGDRYIAKKKKMVGKYTCTLQIKGPTQADQGVYKVTATNNRGTHSVEQPLSLVQVGKEVFKTLD
ncbi:unnamed protein product, partial [Mesorhabditis spiculigera]